jgi:hypothetical protein
MRGIKPVVEVDPLVCTACGGATNVVAVIIDPTARRLANRALRQGAVIHR